MIAMGAFLYVSDLFVNENSGQFVVTVVEDMRAEGVTVNYEAHRAVHVQVLTLRLCKVC